MQAEWEDAHTDYAEPAHRAAPAGLAATESDWRDHVEQDTPNGWLLRGNAMVQRLTSGRPIHLMHTTVALDAIRSTGQLHASSGCLVAALYCAPLTQEAAGLRPHNLGSYLLETKKHTQTLVLEIIPDAPVPPKGVDYLRLGGIHLRTYQEHRSFLTPAEDSRLRRSVLQQVQATASFFDLLLVLATSRCVPEADFIDQLAAAIPEFPFLGYLYFEVLSEYLMLHSASPETKSLAETGELNNRLYKRLAFRAVSGMERLFDLSCFRPGHDTLHQIIGSIEPTLAPQVAGYVQSRLSHLFAALALAPDQDATSFSFQGTDFDVLAAAAPGLLGQALFRRLRVTERYPQLYHCFEQAKALEVWDYWNTEGIATPFNGFLPKGEIGINPAYPRATCGVWTAETCERGLLHPVERVEAVPVARLADLSQTAMRRDGTGRAVGHLRPPHQTVAGPMPAASRPPTRECADDGTAWGHRPPPGA